MKNMSRRQFIGTLGLTGAVMALGLAGCGSNGGNSASTGSSDSKVETIKSRGKLNAGVKKDVLGYGYRHQ